MHHKPRRHWFRFSLRTLLVLVTVVGVWLGWETSAVRQRRAAMQQLKTNPAFHVTTAEAWTQRYPGGAPVAPPAKISRIRTWLGDEAVQEIWYNWYPAPTEAELSRLRRLFPEAQIQEIPAEPCHPGCFPSGTLVDTPAGLRPIEAIGIGDLLTVVLPDGQPVTMPVESVFVTENRLWQIATDVGDLITTETQPLCLADGTTRLAGELQSGDLLGCFQGGQLGSATVLGVTPTDRWERVFNVILGDSAHFVAGGFVVRSKPPVELPSR